MRPNPSIQLPSSEFKSCDAERERERERERKREREKERERERERERKRGLEQAYQYGSIEVCPQILK